MTRPPIRESVEEALRLGGFVRISGDFFGWVYYPEPEAVWPKAPFRVLDPNTVKDLNSEEDL